jgi:hypothetical protein
VSRCNVCHYIENSPQCQALFEKSFRVSACAALIGKNAIRARFLPERGESPDTPRPAPAGDPRDGLRVSFPIFTSKSKNLFSEVS